MYLDLFLDCVIPFKKNNQVILFSELKLFSDFHGLIFFSKSQSDVSMTLPTSCVALGK